MFYINIIFQIPYCSKKLCLLDAYDEEINVYQSINLKFKNLHLCLGVLCCPGPVLLPFSGSLLSLHFCAQMCVFSSQYFPSISLAAPPPSPLSKKVHTFFFFIMDIKDN